MSKATAIGSLGLVVLVVAGLWVYTKSKGSVPQAVIQEAASSLTDTLAQEPNVPWQYKLPSDFNNVDYALSFGGVDWGDTSFGDFLFNMALGGINVAGSNLNIDLGDFILGGAKLTTNLNNPVTNKVTVNNPVVDQSCNMCQSSVASQPLLPYNEKLVKVSDTVTTYVPPVATGRNTSAPLIAMASSRPTGNRVTLPAANVYAEAAAMNANKQSMAFIGSVFR